MTEKKTRPVDLNTFQVSLRPERDYRVRTLSVVCRRRVNVKSAIKECSTREEYLMLKQAQRYIAYHFETQLESAAVRLEWIEYRDGSGRWTTGALEVDAGEGFGELKLGLELLETIGKAVERTRGKDTPTDSSFADPDVVLEALGNTRSFIEVERLTVDRDAYWIKTVKTVAAAGRAA